MAGYTYLWEFDVESTRQAEFEREYGPNGAWVALFRQAPGYVETLLVRDARKPGRYLTIDRWESAEAYHGFRAAFAGEYASIDGRCARLTLHEASLGEIRPARKSECRHIAQFYRTSSGGVADYIWTKLAEPGEDPLDVGRRRYEREGTPFSYQNCRVVEKEGALIGMLVGFPLVVDSESVETDPILAPYRVLEEDQSYYVCGLAVDAAHRRKGIGSALMTEADRICGSLGLQKLSLIVFDRNSAAKRLYARCGYVETRREAVVPHPLLRYAGDACLMVKPLRQSDRRSI
jgi:ribosomal protein S18 acetylase RimI-like enzyme/heme-degrading monooxygenase HmoA